MNPNSGRVFAYNELEEADPVFVTYDHIMKTYFPYWKEQMIKAKERGSVNALDTEISEANCLEDFLTVNWAWEVKDDDDDNASPEAP